LNDHGYPVVITAGIIFIDDFMIRCHGMCEFCRLWQFIRLPVNLRTALGSISLAVVTNWTVGIFRKMGPNIMNA
jgi:hypothetical protein